MIRQADTKDYLAITDLSHQLGYDISPEATLQNLHDILMSNHDYALVYEADGTVVAWIQATEMLRLESEKFVEIVGLVVDQKHRKHGIGKQLIQAIVQVAESKQIPKIRLRSRVDRTEAHAFYRQVGFHDLKTQKVMEVHVNSY